MYFARLDDVIDGLKGQRELSPGQHPGCWISATIALKGQKHNDIYKAYALSGRQLTHISHISPGRCPGLIACWPFRPFSTSLVDVFPMALLIACWLRAETYGIVTVAPGGGFYRTKVWDASLRPIPCPRYLCK